MAIAQCNIDCLVQKKIKTFYCFQLVSEPILQGSVDDADARDARAVMQAGITE